MRISVEIADTCDYCKEGLAYLKELRRRHPECYGTRYTDSEKYIAGLLLIPDYNAAGILCHFHLKREEGEIAPH